jgi:peptidoglycan/xylan/chitin deacetylase (PgdA/CDA1 family)
MRMSLPVALKEAARSVGSSAVFYPWLQRRAGLPGSTIFLTYHTLGQDDDFDAWTVVRVRDFERQIAYLRKDYDIVSIDDALRQPAGDRPRVVLTFDDGHSGWLDHLLPIVEREGLPVTLYTATQHIETGQPYWFDRIMNAAQTTQAVRVDLQAQGVGIHTLGGAVGVAHWRAIGSLLEALKRQPEAARESAARAVEVQMATAPQRRFEPLRPLTVASLQTLVKSPWVTLAAHSHDHRLLDQIDAAQARSSIERSKRKLQAWTGLPVDHFAFPNGNHNASLAACVQALGFKSAATTQHALQRGATQDAFSLPRVFVGRYDGLARFKLSLLQRR